MSNKGYLTPQEERLYRLCRTARGDVKIAQLYAMLGTRANAWPGENADDNTRLQQQRVGAIISRINRKLNGDGKITPGKQRQTYRFIR